MWTAPSDLYLLLHEGEIVDLQMHLHSTDHSKGEKKITIVPSSYLVWLLKLTSLKSIFWLDLLPPILFMPESEWKLLGHAQLFATHGL